MPEVNLPTNGLFVIEIQPDGLVKLKCRTLEATGSLVIPGKVIEPKPIGMNAEDRALIKEAILASVRSGAHGNMDPTSLAESLIAAFNLVDSADPSAVGRTA